MGKMTVTFSLDTEKDRRLVRWLDGLPRKGRSAAIRNALAAHLGQSGVTHQDILDAIQELKRCGVVAASQDGGQQDNDIPADVLENLSKLGM